MQNRERTKLFCSFLPFSYILFVILQLVRRELMNIQELCQLYAHLPQVAALAKVMGDAKSGNIFLDGLLASSPSLLFSALATKCRQTILFIMQDADEAGYLYHDLTQIMGDKQVLFFPSSYRRAIKYGQKDPASEILRTETLCKMKKQRSAAEGKAN